MQKYFGTIIGKLVKTGLIFRPSGGQALPGLIVEKLFPGYVGSMLEKLPDGVVIITGTNGKTTTTKIVVHLLESNSKRVLTNSTGSNLIRGIASSISQHANLRGQLDYDIAILEIDEATARKLVGQIKPKWVLGLNVSRDQLDRYGEVDTIASYIGTAMEAAGGIVTNAGDPHLCGIAEKISAKSNKPVVYFSASDNLSGFFPSDYDLAAVGDAEPKKSEPNASVKLLDFKGQEVTFEIDGESLMSNLKLTGQHNFLNAAAALALCCQLLPDTRAESLVQELANVNLAFGRGETYRLKSGADIELVLVKNPASFTQALSSYSSGNEELMIAINDNIADGRDVSWLWDVNFTPLAGKQIAVTSGTRASDMALRLSYDDIKVQTVENNLEKALYTLSNAKGKKVILATYTAMLSLYSMLSKKGHKI